LPTNLPTNLEAATDQAPAQSDIDAAKAAPSSVIELKARKSSREMAKPEAANTATMTREVGDLVTVRAKPEKRKNAQQRAKERNDERNKDRTEAVEVAAVVPEVGGLSTAHPKPEKRLNAKERAKAKFAKVETKDGTTPMTAKAKSKVETKAKKSKQSRAAGKAA
jgi:hypothetical protein